MTGALVVVIAVGAIAATTRIPASGDSLTIYYTATARGSLEPCGCPVNPAGGVARRAAYIREHAASAEAALLLEGGDFVGPPSEQGLVQTDYLLQSMRDMGYRVLGLGARDFVYGIDFLRIAQDHYGFTLTSANVVDARRGEPLFAPHAIVTVGRGRFLGIPFGGIRVGVVSVMGRDIEPLCVPCDPVIETLDPVESAREAAAEVAGSCDLVVVIASTSFSELERLTTVPHVDAVVASRSHHPRRENDAVSLRDSTVLAYSAYEARRIGYMILSLGADGGAESVRGDLVTLGEDMPDDPDMADMVERYHAELETRDIGDQPQSH